MPLVDGKWHGHVCAGIVQSLFAWNQLLVALKVVEYQSVKYSGGGERVQTTFPIGESCLARSVATIRQTMTPSKRDNCRAVSVIYVMQQICICFHTTISNETEVQTIR